MTQVRPLGKPHQEQAQNAGIQGNLGDAARIGPPANRVQECGRNAVPREMAVHDRTRLTDGSATITPAARSG